MAPSRRTLLVALLTLPFVGITQSPVAHAGPMPANIVGFGGVGTRLVRRFAAEQALPDRYFCALVDYEPLPDRVGPTTLESIGALPGPVEGPLVVVAGLGRLAGGELSRTWARNFKLHNDNHPVRGVLVLPFEWEGKYRRKALEQAALFEAEFDGVERIDNQALATNGSELMRQFAARVDVLALRKIERAANA